MFKKFFLVITIITVVFFLTNLVSAQPKGKGSIKGQIIDKQTNTPVASVSIQIFRLKDSSLVKGMATDENGTFLLTDIPFGMYKLKASMIGYVTYVASNVLLTPQSKDVDLGVIKIEQGDETKTAEIEVTAEMPIFQTQIDKKVYNVEKSLVSESGTLIDVLKNVPSVTVDSEGNIKLRGSSNIKFLINGKPSAILGLDPSTILDQIPASNVQSIEIITNPSSKYEAEGTTGIINFVLKKEQNDGYTGSINLNAGTEDKYNGSANFGIKTGKLTLMGSYNFRIGHMSGTGSVNRISFFADSTYLYNQYLNFNNKMNSHMGNIGLDYDISKKSTLSFSTSYNYRSRNRNEKSNYFNYSPTVLQSSYVRNNYDNHSGNNLDANLAYRLKFDKPKQELVTNLQYSYSDEEINNDILQFNGNTFVNDLTQNDKTNQKFKFYVFQADYTHPFTSDMRLETGFKGTIRDISSDFLSKYLDQNTQSWVINTNLSNNLDYKDQVYGAYINFANKYKDFGYQLGVRLEQTYTKINQLTLNQTFENNYLDIFPSVFLSQTFDKLNEVQINYTRRINRPNMWQLNPFIDYSDPQNLRKGNPYLNPEYVNSFELSYLRYFTTFTLTGTIFYRNVNDVINRVVNVLDSTSTIVTFDNIAKSKSYGLEIVLAGRIAKWWNLNANFNYSKYTVSGGSKYNDIDNNADVWSVKFMNNFIFPNIAELQIAYFYTGKMVTLQGGLEPMQSLDIGIKRDFFNKRLSLTLRSSDVMNTMKYVMSSSGTNFVIDANRKRNSRALFLTLTYRFGTDQKMLSQKRQKRPQQQNDENPIEDF
ncbi:MAG: TonB-dependent receptor domain-containing protein [Ignavibacteria bacterium]